jgi:YNFM family putative membrane transporter
VLSSRLTPGAPTTNPRRERWALYAGTVAAYADMYVTQPLLPDLSREFGVGPARAGLTVSAVVLAIALASVLYGPLSDAVGRRRVMVACLALLSVATLLCALPRSFGALLALRGLQGLLVPGMTAVSVAYAGDRLEPAELGRAVAGIIAASVVGGLVGRVGSGLVAAAHGWRAAFVVFAALTAVATAVAWRGLAGGRGASPGGLPAATRGLLGHLANPPLVGAYLVGFALFFAWTGIFTYLPYLLSGPPHRLSTGLVSSVYLVYAAGVVSSPLAGRLSGRVPARRLVGLGLATAAAGALLTLGRPLPAVVAGLVVLVLGMFTAQAVVPAFVNATAIEAKGSASGLYLSSYYLGGTLGSALPGLAWQGLGWPGVIAACAGAIGLAGLANATLCGMPARTRAGPS